MINHDQARYRRYRQSIFTCLFQIIFLKYTSNYNVTSDKEYYENKSTMVLRIA